MKEILLDVSKFNKITIEPGKEINLLLQHEGKLIEFLKWVKSSVTTDLYKHLYLQGSQPGIMYGLSKIHKPLVNSFPKLRPNLSVVNPGTYKWAKFFVPLLKSFTLPKTLLNKVRCCLWLPLMWILFSQMCHLWNYWNMF